MADIHIANGIITIVNLDIQDSKAAAILAAYPTERRAEMARRAFKIGLGYLQGAEKE